METFLQIGTMTEPKQGKYVSHSNGIRSYFLSRAVRRTIHIFALRLVSFNEHRWHHRIFAVELCNFYELHYIIYFGHFVCFVNIIGNSNIN